MRIVLIAFLVVFTAAAFAQVPSTSQDPVRKGRMFVYWGWNRAWYTTSNVHLRGEGYDFTLKQVVARDRPTDFDPKVYFSPVTAPIPQYDFRVGYFLRENYSLSFGLDHMKYVMEQDQVVRVSGTISGTETGYNGVYDDTPMAVAEDLLTFEHTDGLNYANLELRRFDQVLSWKMVKVGLSEGIGTGILLPKTNARVLDKERYDEFHLAGYGMSAVAALNVEFYSAFFLQTEIKGGFIHMPDIRTTASRADHADQHFFFAQWNWMIGASFPLVKPKN